jgi:hypothetical protein
VAWLAFALAVTTTLPACSDAEVTAFSRDASLSGSGGAAAGSSRLLDDFSDGDNQTITPGGWWYFRGDGTVPDDGTFGEFGADTLRDGVSNRALHSHASGFSDWGFFVGVDLPGEPDLDARSYTRLSFWARSEPSAVFRNLRVDVLDASNAATGVHFESPIVLGTDWQRYSLPFRDFTRSDHANDPALDLARLTTFEFWVPSADSFDFWLDDLALDP